MKNRIFITLAAVAVAASMAAPVVSQAAEGNRPVRKGYVIVGSGSGVSVNEITDDQLKQKLNIEEIINKLCPGNNGGGQNKPDDKPDTDVPETPDIPETPDVPDTDKPDIDKPDTDNPKPDKPDQDDSSNQTFAKQVVALVNAERAKEGLPALKMAEDVSRAALVRAKETEISFSHTRPDGRGFNTALTEQGVQFRGAGENIAWGQKSPQEVMKGWMNSPGHRANIMNSRYTTIGVGHYQNQKGTNYWTQLFTY
ncbi:CAP domain-containing protein [Extibacter muris]|uniref:CAP domain-containing protein n=1 Tax=Extibacter muris TaxID=1796622 RepID=UPI001D096053|nr:CAP domain-containing protein [Extibacter muris]MCB6200222.1 CAP domain-containing protein [Extibacter muris]MCQ4663075.1 CAP domain-containing protein [Extibacter muris]MCQ4692256.1 CAP domain-containing protein [Extibacter muris]